MNYVHNDRDTILISRLRRLLGKHRTQIRRLLAGGREYAGHGESCPWCHEFWETRRHADYCEAKKARKLLQERI
jgi:hypothetical protein